MDVMGEGGIKLLILKQQNQLLVGLNTIFCSRDMGEYNIRTNTVSTRMGIATERQIKLCGYTPRIQEVYLMIRQCFKARTIISK